MPRDLTTVPAEDPLAVLRALDAAMAGGPAVLPAAQRQPGAASPRPVAVSDAVALVVETSGSTGSPKRVGLSAAALRASATASDAALGGPGRWLLALPAHYIAGVNVLVRSIVAGTSPVVLPQGHFDASAFERAARGMGDGPRLTALVPAQLERVLDDRAASDALAEFAAVLVGGQATPASLLARARDAGVRAVTTYGASETSGGCVYDAAPLPGVVVRVSDGEVQLGGPMLAEGYIDDPARTAAVFVEDAGRRWYRTSDAGVVEGGRLRVLGRLDDVIVSGGEKVPLGAVERVVREIDGQATAVVVARASERWGEEPVVVTETPLDLDETRATVGAVLGRAARPAAVVVVDRLPALASGKPDRVAIRKLVGA